jgi:transposase
VLGVIAEKGLLPGKTVGIDATTLEANAALRSIVRRDSGSGAFRYWAAWRAPSVGRAHIRKRE